MPRHTTDFGGINDEVYPALEKAEHELKDDFTAGEKARMRRGGRRVPDDADRIPRGEKEMEEEAKWMSSLFQ